MSAPAAGWVHLAPTPATAEARNACHGCVDERERPVAEPRDGRAEEEEPLAAEPVRERAAGAAQTTFTAITVDTISPDVGSANPRRSWR